MTGNTYSDAFAVWVTGLPAAGKSTISAALKNALTDQGVTAAVLESGAMKALLAAANCYSESEKGRFYETVASLAAMLTRQGIPVIIDATAHRRVYRDQARRRIPNFIEVYVDCTLRTCMERDAYQRHFGDISGVVPGLQVPYEVPENPDLVIVSDREEATDPHFTTRAAQRVIDLLVTRGLLVEGARANTPISSARL